METNCKWTKNDQCAWGLCFVVFLPTLDSATVSKCGLGASRQKLAVGGKCNHPAEHQPVRMENVSKKKRF